MPSHGTASNNESQAYKLNKGPLASIEAIAADEAARSDSVGKTSSKFSSPAKTGGKPRPDLLTTTKRLTSQLSLTD